MASRWWGMGMSEEMKPQYIGIRVDCAVCKQMKQPHGRSAPVQAMYCDDRCSGYNADPMPGCLWPGESSADFGYTHCTNATRVAETDYTKEELSLINQARLDLANRMLQEKCAMRRDGVPEDEASEALQQKYSAGYDALTHALPAIKNAPGDVEDWWLSRRSGEV